jgi:predicted SAM-dependent methyltransferase
MTLVTRIKRNHPLALRIGRATLKTATAVRTYPLRAQFRRMQNKQLKHYLNATCTPKLQIGSGYNILPGWLNTDCERLCAESVFLDATQPFPLPDQTFGYIFSEHMIEHIAYEQGQSMLAECYRVLKQGGVIRIATPNLANFAGLYCQYGTPASQRYVDWAVAFNGFPRRSSARCFIVNNFVNSSGFGHRFVYDIETLKAAVENVGFQEISICTPGESAHKTLQNIERHGTQIGHDNNIFETVVLEAMRR